MAVRQRVAVAGWHSHQSTRQISAVRMVPVPHCHHANPGDTWAKTDPHHEFSYIKTHFFTMKNTAAAAANNGYFARHNENGARKSARWGPWRFFLL
jgi:hypothetical protein